MDKSLACTEFVQGQDGAGFYQQRRVSRAVSLICLTMWT